ncbi:Fe-S cluster assembly protein SufD [Thauera aromatica]|uniref:Iron-sulfur cluster assembly protein SufD n=1 Tax=Thauera aromatica K172 TaxID=44139 RepID=A0A2R4BLU7_THAAR|nr:Fe-S cluster assembly protein SufD [Thauera aromatica]AVR88297.1 Iron-sulfur cluster assembly protein SufD [Thauera aromatica K172]
MSALDFWVARQRDTAAALPGADIPWLARLRTDAIARFADEGWPTTRRENWRHTSLAFMEQQALAVGEAVPPERILAALRARFDAASPAAAHWLVFIDGRFAPALSTLAELPGGVRLGSLADALAQTPEAVEAAFGQAADGETPAALNAALAADGAWIRLARGSVVEAPIHLVFIAAGAADQHLRNLVIAEAGAQATIVEHYPAGAAGSTLSTAVTRVLAAQDSRLTHLKLQEEGEQAIHLATIEAEQARGAVFASHSLSFGARLARTDIRTRLTGEGAEVLLNGLYHADGRRHVDHHTRIDHASPQGTSREYYRGLLDGSARGVFAGRIIVAQDAQRTDALQRCDNLLLSPLAEADARPELEIYADDVKCAHGATVGQLDEDALFYLRARGVDSEHARQLLTYAFAAEVLERIAQPPLRALGRAALFTRLPGAARLEELS